YLVKVTLLAVTVVTVVAAVLTYAVTLSVWV
ncbi:alcohol dehydrogenase GroES-like domain protein, partial [Vibrio parahaemolyticus V-223/04]